MNYYYAMKEFFGFARRKSSSSLKGLNPRRFSIGSSASSSTLQIQVVRGGYNVDLLKVDASFTKLHKAALLNDEKKVRKQIKNVDVNARDSSDRTPLHLATVNGNLKIIRTLIEAGANVNAQDSDGKTPIVKSIECNHEELVQFFLFADADAELADYQTGNTPLHWALSNGSVKAAQYLLRNAKKLDVNITNNQKETSLHLAVKLPQLCIILEELIANGAHIDAKDDRGKTPLVIATANENTSAVSTLLKYGSNPYSSDDDRHHSNHNNNSINSGNNSVNYQNRKDMIELDNDSWPETDEEGSNYEIPIKESNKPRIGSFKRDSLNRVSSLVDETIVEEIKSEETAEIDIDIDLLSNDKENIAKQLSERSNSVLTVNIEDINNEWRVKLDEKQEENMNLKNECDRYRRIIFEKELQYEREKFEWQKSLLQMDADMKRMQCELEVKTLNSTPEEQLELIKVVRDLNLLMVKLDDRISRNEELQQQKAKSFNEEVFECVRNLLDQMRHEEQLELIKAVRDLNLLMVKLDDRISRNEELQQQMAKSFNEEMLECARNLLDQMRHELTNFRHILGNSVNHDEFKNEENQEKQLSAYELRIAELRSSLERLEDQIQSQELQLIRQSDILSLASTPLRKSSSSRELFISNSMPKSWFVQTLVRLQSHIQSNTPTGDTITQFAHQKKSLQKQIHDLKSELGLFAESVH